MKLDFLFLGGGGLFGEGTPTPPCPDVTLPAQVDTGAEVRLVPLWSDL